MIKNIFVGNLKSSTTLETLRSLFEPLGTIHRLKLMTDPETGLSRGFAFVEMPEVEAGPAISALDSRVVDGQTINVREARPRLHPRAPRPDRPAGPSPDAVQPAV